MTRFPRFEASAAGTFEVYKGIIQQFDLKVRQPVSK